MSNANPDKKKKLSPAESERLAIQKLSESGHDADKHEHIVRKVHADYVAKGFLPVKLRQGTKAPFVPNWQTNGNPNGNDFFHYYNIGVALGDKSVSKFIRADGEEVEVQLLDIDNDIKGLPEAALDYFLPPTNFKFGRFYNTDKQKLNHRLYRFEDTGHSFKKPGIRLISPNGKPQSQCVELRSTGNQTMFPGSTIWDDKGGYVDCVMWEGATFDIPEGLPPVVDAERINRDINLMTLSHLACGQFSEGNFHHSNLGWVGFLLKSGYSPDDVTKSVKYIFDQTDQTNLESRLADIDSTLRLMEEDEMKVSGIKTLLDEAGWDKEVISDIRKISGGSKQDMGDGRPKVLLVDSKEVLWVDKTLEAMVETKMFYNMDDSACIITKDGNSARLQILNDPTATASWLSRGILFTKNILDKSLNQFTEVPTVCPPQIAKDIANTGTSKGGLPKLNGLCTHPVVTIDGRIIEDAWKYDPELRLFFACESEVNGMYPDQATEVLRDLVQDFPFEQASHTIEEEDTPPVGNLVFPDPKCVPPYERMGRYMAAAISGIMTNVCRPVLDICPMYYVSSPQHSDGKSVLSGVIAAAVGCEAASGALTKSGNAEEQEKQLCAILLRGRPVVVFDNMDGEFRSLPLVEVLTSTHPEFRILGKSETRSIPNKTFFISNGVNHLPALDLQTRSVAVKLARSDMDSNRKFKYMDVVGHTHKIRSNVQSAVISLIKWAQTQPDGNWKPTHRFKMWDQLVRRTIMITYGVDIAPPVNEDIDRVMDPKEETRGMFLRYLKHCWDIGVREKSSKGKERAFFRAKTLADRIVDGTDEDDWLCILSGRSKNYSVTQRLGFALGGLRGVPFEENGEIYRLARTEVDKMSAYKIEVRKVTPNGSYFWV